MRWYDYFVCGYCADLLSAGLIHFDVVVLLIGAVTYLSYEQIRKNSVPL